MNINKLLTLVWFEFSQNLIRLKGLLFIIPYFLFWYLILNNLSGNVSTWLRGQEGMAFASWLFNYETALSLFQNHPASLSIYYILALTTLPAFVFLGANDQLSSDARSGVFRFLLTRVTRSEIFLSRAVSVFLLIAISIGITSFSAGVISFQNNEGELQEIINYTLQINTVLLFYSLPFIAYMAIISTITITALGCLFLGFSLYCFMLIIIITNKPDLPFLPYLLPSGIKNTLFILEINSFLLALTLCTIYTLIYAGTGWLIFRKRDL